MFKLTEQPEVIASRIESEDERAAFLAGVHAEPLTFYVPNGANERYIKTIARCREESNVPVVVFNAANGVGKTHTTVHAILNLTLGPQNGWFDYDIFHNFPYPKRLWYCSTADTLRDTIEPMIDEIVIPELRPEVEYRKDKQGKSIVSKLIFPNGWIWFFKTYDQKAEAFEAATVGAIVLDEPAPEYIWKAIKSRRRKGCLILYPNTPLYCPPYMIDELQKAADEGIAGYFSLKADVYEACKERGTRGHLDADIIDNMVDSYDEEEKQARVYGEYMYFSGRIYPSLSKDIHFVEPSDYPIPPHSAIVNIVDPHDSRPSAAIWGAVTPQGRKIVFAESPEDRSRPYWDMKDKADMTAEIAEWAGIEAEYYDKQVIGSGVRRIMDRYFGWQTRGQRTMAGLYMAAGKELGKTFNFDKSYTSNSDEGEIQYGHKMVRSALKPMADGKPGLVIWNTCYHTWNGLTHYIRERNTGKKGESKAQADGKIVEKYKDFPDTVRYFVCADIKATAPAPQKTPVAKKLARIKRGKRKVSAEYA